MFTTQDFEKDTPPLNVLVIVSDALSAGHMSLYGYPRETTPFLKSFFTSSGIIYTQAKSTAGWTLPSFASFMRSKMPTEIPTRLLLQDRETLPAILRRNGVQNVAFLKDFSKPIATLQSIANLYTPDERTTTNYHDHESSFLEANDWINTYELQEEESRKPFCMLIHNTTPHNPYEDAPDTYRNFFGFGDTGGPTTNKPYLEGLTEDISEHERERIVLLYDQEIRYLDDLVKKFIEKLSKEILESTILIFTSDHGDEFGAHNGKFNHGASLYEELIHIPLLVRIPGTSACTITEPVSLLDLMPTILTNFNIQTPKDADGRVLPLENERLHIERILKAEGSATSFETQSDLSSLSAKNKKRNVLDPAQMYSFTLDEWKLIIMNEITIELYNIKDDQMETKNCYWDKNNLSEIDQKKVRALLKEALTTCQ